MRYWPRFALLVTFAAGCVLGSCCLALVAWHASPFATLASGLRAADRFERANEAQRARRQFKAALVERLAEGKFSLRDAVARLLDYHDRELAGLRAGEPDELYGRGAVRVIGAGSDQERCARSLISHVRSRPERASAR